MPTPSARPESDMIFNVTPEKYINTIAVTTLSGMEQATIIVGRKSHRNKSRITIESKPPINKFCTTESTTRSIYTPWFISILI